MSHPSVFPQGTIAKDKYYYAFYTVSKKDLNTIHMKLYDNNRTLVEEKSHRFSSINAVELLKKINNGGSNPLVIGHNTDVSSNIDIAASGLYQQGWNIKQQDRLMRDINQDYANVYNNVTETYDISYDGATYSLTQDGVDVSSTDLYVKQGLHVFDLNSLSANNQSFLTFEPLTYGSTLPPIHNEGTLGSTYVYQTLRVDDFTPDMKFYIVPGQDLGRIYNNFSSAPARTFEVTIANGVYYIDGIERPKLFLFKDGNYVFLQTTADNTGNLLQFSSSSFENGLVVFNDGVLTKGVPGNQTYAYSAIEISGDSSVYYYNYDVSNVDMGNRITRADFDVSFNVQVETNLQGENVFAFYDVDLDTHIKQPVLPITYITDYNKVYYFDMSHISNSGEILTFGFNADIDSGSTSAFDISYATHSLESPGSAGAFIALDLREFYFEAVTARSVDYGLYNKSYSGVSFKVSFASGLPDGSGVFQVVDSQGVVVPIQSPAPTTLLYGKSEVDIVLEPNVPTGTYYIQDANNPSMDVLTLEHEYAYSVSVVNNVFYVNSVPQAQISFVKNQTYKFIQEDSSNAGKPIVFGRSPDASTLYTIGVVNNGIPGQPGAYTELTLDNSFAGSLYYYSSTALNMGYSPVSIAVDSTTKSFNDALVFSISNNTGVDVSYAITGVDVSDLSGDSYTGNLTYGTIHTLSYVVKTIEKTVLMTAGAANTTITILDMDPTYKYTFGVQPSYYGDPVFAVYDVSDQAWYNQTDLSFSPPNVYVFDLSSSLINGGYTLVFGSTVNDMSTLVPDSIIYRKTADNQIILDLNGYSESVTYFEDSSANANMAYIPIDTSNVNNYFMKVLNGLYDVSGTPQLQIEFEPNTSYIFDQSDPTNIGQQLILGHTYDDKTNLYTTGVRTVGTPGQPGAYTQIALPSDYADGTLFYYSDSSNNMGYAPLSLTVDATTKLSGDNITYIIFNNTGINVPYTITGIVSTDISGESLTGNVPYGGITNITYTLTNTSNVNMTMTVGTESQTTNVYNAIRAYVRVQNSKYEISEDGTTWIINPLLYLTNPNLYVFYVSDSTNSGYEITFGTTVDDITSVVDSSLIARQGTPGQPDSFVFLDLATYSGDILYYFDVSNSNMGHISGLMTQQDIVTETKTFDGKTKETIYLPEELVFDGDYKISVTFTRDDVTNIYGFIGLQPDRDYPLGSYQGEDPSDPTTSSTSNRQNTYGIWTYSDGKNHQALCSNIYLTTAVTASATNVLEFGRTNGTFIVTMNNEVFNDPPQNTTFMALKKEATILLKIITLGDWLWGNPGTFKGTIEQMSLHYPAKPTVLLLTTTTYKVRVQNGVYALSVDNGTIWRETPRIDFKPYDNLIFDQSDSTNAGEQIVFGTTYDDKVNILGTADGVTVNGTPGTAGAYTQLELDGGFSGDLYYYSANTNDIGFNPYELSVDGTIKETGDTVAFTVSNHSSTPASYTITGVTSADINNEPLTGTIAANTSTTLVYTLTGTTNATMTFTLGGLSETITILITYEFTVQDNIFNQKVWAVYNSVDGVYYNQPNILFSAPNVYKFNLSSSVINGGYVLAFGTEADNSSSVVETGYVTRDTSTVLLDLRNYNGGQALTYFDNSIAGMGYVDPDLSPPDGPDSPTTDLHTHLEFEDDPVVSNTVKNTGSGEDAGYSGWEQSTFSKVGTHSFKNTGGTITQSVPSDLWDSSYTFSLWHYMTQNNNQAIYIDYFQGYGLSILNKELIYWPYHGAANVVISSTYNLNTWYHICVIHTKSSSLQFYVDGTLKSTITGFAKPNPVQDFSIGGYRHKRAFHNTMWNNYLDDFRYYQRALDVNEIIALVGPGPIVQYNVAVAVSGSSPVFDISGTLQLQIDFKKGGTYIFHQSDLTNAGEQIVFGTTSDDKNNLYTTGVTVIGTPGQQDAYTQFKVPYSAPNVLYYYSLNSNGMGYNP